jgi:hypothetical protein
LPVLQVILLDEVRDDFGIGFGGEFVSFGNQLFLEREIVFDNAVVHDHDSAGAVAMGMRVFFGGAAVRGPAGVSDAVGAVERLEADHFFQIAQLAFGAADFKPRAVSGHGDSGRVVAAILQLSQALNDDGDDLLLTHISHNAAHGRIGSLTKCSVGDPATPVRETCARPGAKRGNLLFEGETKLFNDRVRENFARHLSTSACASSFEIPPLRVISKYFPCLTSCKLL